MPIVCLPCLAHLSVAPHDGAAVAATAGAGASGGGGGCGGGKSPTSGDDMSCRAHNKADRRCQK